MKPNANGNVRHEPNKAVTEPRSPESLKHLPRAPQADKVETRHNGAGAEWFTPGRFAFILAASIFAAYPEVVLGMRTFFFRDFGYFGYPLAFHHRESFWRGELPLWNPLSNCGLPFLAQWNTMTLYPGSAFYLLFPLSWSLGVFCLLHQFLAGLGMYFLARDWTGSRLAASVAGLAFAFNGLILNCLMWPNNIAALGWMPWVVLLTERACRHGGKAIVSAGLAGAAQMLSGAPEVILLTWLFVGALGIGFWLPDSSMRRRMFWPVLAVPLLVAGLSAIQLLPFLDLLAHSQRNESFADSSWAMPAWGWANLLVPLFYCFTKFFGVYAQYGQYWTSSYYLGVGVLLLALTAVWQVRDRRVWFLAAMALLSGILALGGKGQLFVWLRTAFPPFAFMRYPIKFIVWAVFCAPLLAAYAVRRLAESPTAPAFRAWRSAAVTGSLLMVLGTGIVWFAWRHPLFPGNWAITWQNGVSRAVFLILTLAALYGLVRWSVPVKKIVGLVVLALVGLDTLTHMPRQNPVIPRSAFYPGLAPLTPRPRYGESRAMISPAAQVLFHSFSSTNAFTDYLVGRSGLFVNCNLLDNIPKVDGLYSLYLREPDKVERALLYPSTNFNPQLTALLDFLGVAQFTAPGGPAHWQYRPTHMPMATAGQRPVFAGADDTLKAIANPAFDPRQAVYLPPEAKSFIAATNRSASEIIRADFARHHAEIQIRGETPCLLTIAQADYHRWRADVDGRPVKVWRANYAFQALEVPAGQHLVRLKYEDRLFQAGSLISILSIVGCLLWVRRSVNAPPSRGVL